MLIGSLPDPVEDQLLRGGDPVISSPDWELTSFLSAEARDEREGGNGGIDGSCDLLNGVTIWTGFATAIGFEE